MLTNNNDVGEKIDRRRVQSEQRAAEIARFLEQLNPGVILTDSWGYEQTNVEFYRVIERKGSKVLIQELLVKPVRANSWASDYVVAGADDTRKPPEWRTVRGPRVKINDSISLRVWDGKECYRSWYG